MNRSLSLREPRGRGAARNLLLNLFCLMLILGAASAHAAITLDQVCPLPAVSELEVRTGAGAGTDFNLHIAQSFTVGLAGTLVRVEPFVGRYLHDPPFDTPGDMVVEVFEATGGPPSGPALATVVVPGLSVPSTPRYFSVDLLFAQIEVLPGRKLAVSIRETNSPVPHVSHFFWRGGVQNPYPPGAYYTHYYRTTPDPWRIACAAQDCDLAFRTYVEAGCPVFTFKTGQNGAGADDANFLLVDAPAGVSIGSRAVGIAPGGLPFDAITEGTNSYWVGPTAIPSVPLGPYRYQARFTLNCTNDARILGQFAADDAGRIHLNGQPSGVVAGHTAWTPVKITSGFVPGVNVLDVWVTNSGSATGFRAELYGQSECCPPCLPTGDLVLCAAAENSALNAVDSSHGTLLGSAGYAAGKIGQAFVLNGPSDQVVFTHTSPLLLNSSFSFEAWVNPETLNNAPVIFEKGAAVANRVGLQVFSDGTVCGYFDSGFCTTYTGPGEVAANVWTHLAFVYDCGAGQALVYVNGALKNSLPAASRPLGSAAPLTLGGSSVFTGHEFRGRLDEVCLYTRALSGTEVAAHAASTNSKCAPCTNELRFACAGTTNFVFTAGGTNDNFTGPEAASPSAGVVGRFSTLVGFDECPTSAVFGHTFSNLPPCITAARVCVRLKPCDSVNCGDEVINFAFVGPSSQLLPPGYWVNYLGTGNPAPGLLNSNWCTVTDGATFCLDLANLPPTFSGGPTDLIPAMNQHGFLDFISGNESAVDWIRLEVESCCCHADINVPNDPGQCAALVQYVPPTAIGGCSPNVTVTCTPPSGLFPVGTNTVTCIATNGAGQSATCTFRVTVRDTEPPAFICPTNAIAAVDCASPAVSISATDNCTPAAGLTFTQTPPANTPVGPGLHSVSIIICDAAGNCSPCTVLVEARGLEERIFSIRTGISCGAPLPVSGKDANFIAIGHEALGRSGLGDATVMPPSEFGPGWLPNNGVSQWVHATGSNYQTAGFTTYRATFSLACTNAVISGRFAGHKAAVLRINGVNVVGAGPTSWRSVNYTGPFVVGLNTLDIVTEDFPLAGEGNPGIRAELDAVAECCGCPTFTSTACLPPPSGLTHWYPGNPDARDVTGRNPGVLESGALAGQPGHVGRAFRFNGVSGGVDLGNVPDFDFNQCSSFSIEGWFNSTGPGNIEQTVVALNYDNNGNCAVTVQAVVLVPHDAVSDVVRFIIRDAANVASTLTSPPVAKNAFHHFAAVRDATAMPHQMRLYVDCQLVAQGTDVTTAALARNGSDFIGRRNACNSANVFNGFIDELSFYNRPLSGYEVARISANGSRGKCHPSCYPSLQGSLGWWAGNANAKDTSGKGRHGTMQDGAGFAPGAVRQSFRFDGVNDYMHVPAHLSLNPSGPITLGAWVNPDQYSGVTAVIAGKPFGFQLDLLPTGRARFAVPVSASVFLSVDTTTALPLNQFTHLTATYGYGPTLSSRRLDIYVDGVWNNTLHDAGAPVIYHPPGAPLQIGGFNHSSFVGGFFKGRIDEVRLLNGVLSAMDIKAMCAAGSRGPCQGAILPIVNAGQLLLEWEGGGVLERASALGQPWQELPEATSPHGVPMDGASGFFRIRIIDTGEDD